MVYDYRATMAYDYETRAGYDSENDRDVFDKFSERIS